MDHTPACTAEEALERLKASNARFVGGQGHFPSLPKEILADLAGGQQPYATILGCSDSRVPPELVFDTGLGELFTVRVAGNVLGPSIQGTLQYAAEHLHTSLFVVMGHEGCGAVKAALAAWVSAVARPVTAARPARPLHRPVLRAVMAATVWRLPAEPVALVAPAAMPAAPVVPRPPVRAASVGRLPTALAVAAVLAVKRPRP